MKNFCEHKIIFLLVVFLSVSFANELRANETDSIKVAQLKNKMIECIQVLNEKADSSDVSGYLNRVSLAVGKLKHYSGQYIQMTNDSSALSFVYLGETLLSLAYSAHHESDSALVHAQNALQLYEPYGRILISTSSDGTNNALAVMTFGDGGIYALVRDYCMERGKYDDAMEFTHEMYDSCLYYKLDYEAVAALCVESDILKQREDYQASINKRIESLDRRINLPDKTVEPTASHIFFDILITYREYANKARFLYNSTDSSQFKSFDNYTIIFSEILKKYNFILNVNEGKTYWKRQVVETTIGILSDINQYPALIKSVPEFNTFYSETFGNESVEYNSWLLKLSEIYDYYSNRIDDEKESRYYLQKSDSLLIGVASFWEKNLSTEGLDDLLSCYTEAVSLNLNSRLDYTTKLIDYSHFLVKWSSYNKMHGYYSEARTSIYNYSRIIEAFGEDSNEFLCEQLGHVSMFEKKYQDAEGCFLKALEFAKQKNDSINMAIGLLSLSDLYSLQVYDLKYYDLAFKSAMDAYYIVSNLNSHSSMKAEAYLKMSNIFEVMNDYEMSYKLYIDYLNEKRYCYEKITESDYIDEAEKVSKWVGRIDYFDNNLLNIILDIANKQDTTITVRRACELLGPNYVLFSDDKERGFLYYKKAANIAEALKDTINWANDLSEMGVILFSNKDYVDAYRYLSQAENICPQIKQQFFLFLMAYVKSDSIDNCLATHFEIGKNKIKRQMLLLNAKGRERFTKFDANTVYMAFRSMPYFYKESEKSKDIAYNSALLYKGLLLNAQRNISELVAKSENVELQEQYANFQRIENQIQIDLTLNSKQKTNLSIEAANIEKTLLSSLSDNNVLSDIDISWKDVQKRLKKNDVAIEFVEINNLEPLNNSAIAYGALVIRKGFKHPVFVELESKNNIDDVIEMIIQSFNRGSGLNQNRWNTLSNQLYNGIWGKLENYIQPGDNIYFSPTGLLHQAPIEILNDNNGRIISEICNVYRLSSTRELCKNKKTDFSSAVLYGGLEYNSDANNQEEIDSRLAFHAPQDSISRAGWNYLPSTAIEIEGICSRLDSVGIRTMIRKGKDGTEKSFRELSGMNTSILHIATHGFYFQRKESESQEYYKDKNTNYSSPMQRTGLMMSGGQPAWLGIVSVNPNDDGILLADEIAELDLSNTNLVVLSACQTGLGYVDEGGEGVYGIQRAFKLAGVNSILMTLGKVDDKATQLFMNCFYKNLSNGISPYESYKNAQNYVRNYEYDYNGYKMNYKNPRFWAPFILLDAVN